MSATVRHISAWQGPLMGGPCEIQLAIPDEPAFERATSEAIDGARAVARRLGCWADRLSRFVADSEVSRLHHAGSVASVGPTLRAVLEWAREARARTAGVVDITLLEARLAAEAGSGPIGTDSARTCPTAWSISPGRRGGTVRRSPGARFDLDGVAKGWLADRALARLHRYRGALVDADGDLAVRVAPGDAWDVGIAEPGGPGEVAVLRLRAGTTPRTFGVATSGTSVHRWTDGRHHLIDPRTGRPAETDVVQATVVARSAAHAEADAKAVVILGSAAGLALVDRREVAGAVVVLADGRVLATLPTLSLLEAA